MLFHFLGKKTATAFVIPREMHVKPTILPLLLLGIGPALFAATKTKAPLTPEAAFTKTVQPFLASNCLGCHNKTNKIASLDLQQFDSIESVRANLKIWRKVAFKLEQGDMPPAKAPQPKLAARKAVLKWVNSELAKAQVAQR